MGCHTWFYKEVENQPSQEEVKNFVANEYKNAIIKYKSYLAGTFSDEIGTVEYLDTMPKDVITRQVEVLERCHKMILDDRCSEAVCNKYDDMNCHGHSYSRKTNKFYAEVEGLHDLFRYRTSKDIQLHSLDETLELIKNGGVDTLAHNLTAELEVFWKTYPDGMIEFG